MTTSIIRLVAFITLLLVARTGLAAVVLQYHHVSADSPAATSVTPAQFREHLKHLDNAGFRVMALDQLVDAVQSGLDPREKVAAITFDDGYRSVYEKALPMLEARGWSAAIFVNTDGVRQRWEDMMTPEMLREAAQRGHLILNHTRTHPHMVRKREGESETAWRGRMREEIVSAQQALENWLGEDVPRYLAWPYGEHTPALRALASELSFVAFGQQTGALGGVTDWQQVPRIPINRHYADWQGLSEKVTALPLPVIDVQPDNGITDREKPLLTLTLTGDWAGKVTCFAAGGRASVEGEQKGGNTVLKVRSREALSEGRHRYNCTAAAGDGRYYWYSHLWMRRDGERWYPEP